MKKWTRQPQENDGGFMFDGNFIYTESVKKSLSSNEIETIYSETRKTALKCNGLNWLQVFSNEDGQKLLFIASINQRVIEICGYNLIGQESNNSVLLFDYEY
jgi:hypothetical protein